MKHGTLKQVRLAIVELVMTPNKNDRYSLVTETSEYNPKGVFQFTLNHINNLATKAFAGINADVLASAISIGNQMLEESFLSITFKWCEAGQAIGVNPDGTPIVSDSGETVFTKDHWRTESYDGIELAEEAVDYIKELVKELDRESLRESRKGRDSKRKGRQLSKGVVDMPEKTEEPVIVDESDADADTEADANALFGEDSE